MKLPKSFSMYDGDVTVSVDESYNVNIADCGSQATFNQRDVESVVRIFPTSQGEWEFVAEKLMALMP